LNTNKKILISINKGKLRSRFSFKYYIW